MTPLTAKHRRQQLALRAQVLLGLRRIWPTLDVGDLDASFPGWASSVGALVVSNRGVSAALAQRYLRQVRVAAGVPGPPPAPGPRDLPPAVLLSSLAVTGPVAVKKSISRGVEPSRAMDAAFVLSAGAVARHVLDAGRETVMRSLAEDDRAVGWRRVTSPRACEFCDSLEDIYPPGYGDFQAHDGCMCSAAPEYR